MKTTKSKMKKLYENVIKKENVEDKKALYKNGVPQLIKADDESIYLSRVDKNSDGLEDILFTIPKNDITKKIVLAYLNNTVNYMKGDEGWLKPVPKNILNDPEVKAKIDKLIKDSQ